MKKLKLYLDTSVVSYLDQKDTPIEMKQTQDLWEILKTGKYNILLSPVVFEEIDRCTEGKKEVLYNYLSMINYETAIATEDTDTLSQYIIEKGILTEKQLLDTYHIAFAIENGCDIILSWNFAHIVNIETINGIRKITFDTQYNKIIDIYAPYVLLNKEVDNNG